MRPTHIFILFVCAIFIGVVSNFVTLILIRHVKSEKTWLRIIFVYACSIFVAIVALYKLLVITT